MKFIFLKIILFLAIAGNINCSPRTYSSTSSSVQVTATYITMPLIKGLSFNPAIRMRIYVPPGQGMQARNIHIRMDEAAVDAIEKLDILIRDETKQGFLENARILGSASPSKELELPVDLFLKPGITNLWISAVVKKEADIDRKPMLQALSLNAGTGETYPAKAQSQSSGLKPEFTRRIGIAVRKAWDDSVNTYRIPGMTTTDKGTLIAVYDIRYNSSRDLPANIDVGMSRSIDGGKTWEPMKIIMDMGPPDENNGVGDPAVLFDPATKKLWVAALWSKGNRSIAGSEPGLSPDTTGQLVLVSSSDDGLTWSAPHSITSQVKDPAWHLYFNGPGNGIAMQNGTLVFASQYWDESRKPGIPHSSIIYSQDHGNTWKSGAGAKYNTTESQVVETTPGTLMLNMRDNRGSTRTVGSFRSIATTTDLGKTWVEHPTSFEALPDPVCMASLIKAGVMIQGKMKDVLFFSNVASQTIRQNTTIKASLDLGETWLPENQLLLDSRTGYGYSALTRIDDNTVGILYEGERDLYFLRIPVRDIIKR